MSIIPERPKQTSSAEDGQGEGLRGLTECQSSLSDRRLNPKRRTGKLGVGLLTTGRFSDRQ